MSRAQRPAQPAAPPSVFSRLGWRQRASLALGAALCLGLGAAAGSLLARGARAGGAGGAGGAGAAGAVSGSVSAGLAGSASRGAARPLAQVEAEAAVAAAAPPAADTAPAAAAAAAAAAASSPSPSAWETAQTCYTLSDDSEFCVYEGPVCAAGAAQLVALSSAPLRTLEYRDADGRGGVSCADGRDFEQRENCSPLPILRLDGRSDVEPWGPPPAAVAANASAAAAWRLARAREGGPALASGPWGAGRSWGPLGRNLPFGHVPAAWVARVTTAEALREAGAPAALVAGLDEARRAEAARLEPAAPYPALAGPPARVTWLPVGGGAVAWAALSDDAFGHPWHLSIASLQLWAARRLNTSAVLLPRVGSDAVGGGGGASPFALSAGTPGGSGALPAVAMLHLLSTAPLPHTSRRSLTSVSPWVSATLHLLTPAGADIVLPADAIARWGGGAPVPDPAHWLCAPRALVLGEKTRMFTGAGDAHAWRRAAYSVAGLPPAAAWPPLPPRTITLIVRRASRGWTNARDLRALLARAGLPLRLLVLDGAGAERDWAAQVAAFAGTGILVAAHGAALANLPFLPPHAALIEVFSYLGKVPVFRRVAEVARVTYHPVRAHAPSHAALTSGKPGVHLWNTSDYLELCERGGLSSAEAPLLVACSLAVRNAYIEAPLDDIARALDHALDDIGCRNSLCFEADGSFTDYKPRAAAAVAAQEALPDDGV